LRRRTEGLLTGREENEKREEEEAQRRFLGHYEKE